MPDEAIDLMALAVCIRQGRDTTILQDELGLMSTEYLTWMLPVCLITPAVKIYAPLFPQGYATTSTFRAHHKDVPRLNSGGDSEDGTIVLLYS